MVSSGRLRRVTILPFSLRLCCCCRCCCSLVPFLLFGSVFYQFSTPNAVRDFSEIVSTAGAKVLPLAELLALPTEELSTVPPGLPKVRVIGDASLFEDSLATDPGFATAHSRDLMVDFWWVIDSVTDQRLNNPLEYAVDLVDDSMSE